MYSLVHEIKTVCTSSLPCMHACIFQTFMHFVILYYYINILSDDIMITWQHDFGIWYHFIPILTPLWYKFSRFYFHIIVYHWYQCTFNSAGDENVFYNSFCKIQLNIFNPLHFQLNAFSTQCIFNSIHFQPNTFSTQHIFNF